MSSDPQDTLTEEDLLEICEELDTNNDGYIAPGELAEGLKKHGDHLSMEEIEEILRNCDTDKDGRVRYREFIEGVLNKP